MIKGINQRAKEYNGNEHRRIWEKHYGQIEKGYVIHHKDFDKKNNSIENLECLTKKEHGEKHKLPNRIHCCIRGS
jgi:hypothetical protein